MSRSSSPARSAVKTAIASLLTVATLTAAAPASANTREITLGIGTSSFSREVSEGGAVFALEYAHTPVYERGNFTLRFGAVLDVQHTGDIFGGAGVAGRWDLEGDYFIDARVMPGAYFAHAERNDLGATFEVRSQFAVGRAFGDGRAISIALAHKSNASTGRFNPGVNSLLLRWHTAY